MHTIGGSTSMMSFCRLVALRVRFVVSYFLFPRQWILLPFPGLNRRRAIIISSAMSRRPPMRGPMSNTYNIPSVLPRWLFLCSRQLSSCFQEGTFFLRWLHSTRRTQQVMCTLFALSCWIYLVFFSWGGGRGITAIYRRLMLGFHGFLPFLVSNSSSCCLWG